MKRRYIICSSAVGEAPSDRASRPFVTPGIARALVAVFLAVPGLLGAQTLGTPDTRTDEWLTNPVGDATFETYLDFFSYNEALPFSVEVSESSTDGGVRVDRLTYESTPGMRVTARLHRPGDGAPRRGGVVMLHGGVTAGKDSRSILRFSDLMARDGWTVLAIDMLHYGERDTGLFETYTSVEKVERLYGEPSTYLEFVVQTVKDVSRAYDLLVADYGVDPERVTLVGFSRGAVLGSIAAAADDRISAAALLHGGHWAYDVSLHRGAACPANYIGRISPRAVLMVNTTADAIFPPETTIRPWMALANEPLETRWLDTPHGFMNDEDVGVLLDWMRRSVG